jgi:hypothetical protein
MVIGKVYVHKGDGQRARWLDNNNLELLPQGTLYQAIRTYNLGSHWIPEDEYVVGKVLKKYNG